MLARSRHISRAAHDMSDTPQGPTLGRYVLERRIASGGMADVYLARQSGPYGFVKRVALKVLKSEIAGDDDNVKAFIREALVAAEFRHPNLAQVYEVGEVGGRLFIAMELVRGLSVAAMNHMLLKRERELPRNVAVRIAIDTLDGLAHAHEANGTDGKPLGLVHRDVSPQNIMVSVDGSVKVVDFGIARAEMAFGRTIAPRIKGKFSYMAPEQWETSSQLDARADLFALGVVLYEMTTGGVRLFRGDTPKDLYKAVVIDPIADPRSRDPKYPEPLARIVMRALERGPSARWSSARAMRTALVEFAQSENWSLSSKAVADAVRAALGPSEIESHWEPMAEGQVEISRDPDSVPTQVDPAAPSRQELPTRPEASPSPRRTSTSADPTAPRVSTAVAVGGAMAGLLIGFCGGFALARASVHPVPPNTMAPPADPHEHGLHVAMASSLAPSRTPLATRWRVVHPSITLQLDTDVGDAIQAVISRRADFGISDRAPTGDDLANAVRSGGALEVLPIAPMPGAGTSRWLVGREPITGAARAFADWVRAPEVVDAL